MTSKEAIKRLQKIDIKYFISSKMEQSNYIVDEADKINEAIEIVLYILEEQNKKIRELKKQRKDSILVVRDNTVKMYEQVEMDLESRITDLEIENESLKKDMKNMYNEEVIISIICDNFNLTRSEVLNLLED